MRPGTMPGLSGAGAPSPGLPADTRLIDGGAAPNPAPMLKTTGQTWANRDCRQMRLEGPNFCEKTVVVGNPHPSTWRI